VKAAVQSSKDSSQGRNGRHRGSICCVLRGCTVYTPHIRSLSTPSIDFVSQDNNNLHTTHYLKRLDSLIFVTTARAVLWTALHTPQHCSGGHSSRSSIYLHPRNTRHHCGTV